MYFNKKGFHPIFLESCTSTMDVAKQVVQQNPRDDVVCVAAQNQTAGRGRGGSVWTQRHVHSKQDDFLPVTLVFPDDKIKIPMEWITSAVGCAVFDALKKTEDFLRTSLSSFFAANQNEILHIKWPNDLVYVSANHGFKKICGILCENIFSQQDKKNYYLIGIGLNFLSAPEIPGAGSFLDGVIEKNVFKNLEKDFRKEVSRKSYQMALIEKFSDFLCDELFEYLCHPRSPQQLKELTLERSLPVGTKISVNKGEQQGRFLGVNDQAALLIEGVPNPVFSGDVSCQGEWRSRPKTGKKAILAIDFGNSRIHMMCQNGKGEQKAIHIAYDSLTEKSVRPLADFFSSDKHIQILFTSVVGMDRTKLALKKIKSHINHFSPQVTFSEIQVTEEEIFKNIRIKGDFEKDKLGADRALKFLFAAQQAQQQKKNILVLSFGTAITCEGVSADGHILENFVCPGIQMSFQAMNHYTALLPALTANPQMFSPQGKHWNQEIYMQRGVFLSAASTVIVSAQMHGDCVCYLNGGNADQMMEIIQKIIPKSSNKIKLILCENIETQMLLQNAKDFSDLHETKSDLKGTESAQESILKTMLKPRMLKKEDRKIEPRLEDFRRIGARIEDGTKGSRIDSYLSAKFPFHSREVWYDRISNAEVMVEHGSSRERLNAEKPKLSRVKPTYKLKERDQIWLFHPQEYEPDAAESMDVIFDDGDLCVFSKPPNMVVHASGIYGRNTFIHLAEKMGYGDCAPVHRIDRETSGILACARKSSTRNLMADAFQKGLIKKMYLAVTQGNTNVPDQFRVTLPIGQPEHSLIRLKLWIHGTNPQPAETYFVKLASHGNRHLFACLPKTGRTNQIRIHLAAIGHWIIGDKMYHENEQVFIDFYEKGYTQWVEEQVLFPRHMLHNAGLMAPSLPLLSLSEKPIVCPLPPDMLECTWVQELLKRGEIPLDSMEQQKYLGDLFLRLHGIDFNDCTEILPQDGILK